MDAARAFLESWVGWLLAEFGALGTIAGLAALLVALWWRWGDRIKEDLTDEMARKRLRDKLAAAHDPLVRYRTYLGWLNGRLDAFFGENPLGYKAFDRCLAIAFLYPLFLFLLTWVLTGKAGLGQVPVMETDAALTVAERAASIALFIAAVIAAVTIAVYGDRLSGWIGGRIRGVPGEQAGSATPLRRGVAAVAEFVAVAVAFAVAFAGAVAFAIAGWGSPEQIVLLTFFLALPLANATLDWASWFATRKFLRWAETAGPGGLLRDLLADAIIAFGCLIALAAIIALVLSGVNMVAAVLGIVPEHGGPLIPWLDELAIAVDDPWGEGLMVTLMLLTTLLPTAIHLTFGIGGLILPVIPGATRAATLIGPGMDLAAIRRVAWTVRFGRLVSTIPALIVVVLTGGLILYGLEVAYAHYVSPAGGMLADAALCATAWDHGQCPPLN